MAELATKPCRYCGRENAVDNTHCKACKCALMVQPCTVCANPIPLGAEYCNGCKSYQDRRRYFGMSTIVLTILTALISVFTPAINALSNFLTRNSNTMMIVRDADETSVHVYFRDSGRQPSQLAKAQLIFGDLPLLSADLQPVEIGVLSTLQTAPIDRRTAAHAHGHGRGDPADDRHEKGEAALHDRGVQ